jgi:hypothetical protein
MQLAPKLTPFWYQPEYQEGTPVRFLLRPLTQQQMIDVESLYGPDGQWTRAAQFHAGMLAIQSCDGVLDDKQEPIRWPIGIDRHGKDATLLRGLVCHAGMRIIAEMNGSDWGNILQTTDRLAENEAKQPAEADPAKT